MVAYCRAQCGSHRKRRSGHCHDQQHERAGGRGLASRDGRGRHCLGYRLAVPRNAFTAPIVTSAVSMFFDTLTALTAALMLGLLVLGRVTCDVDQLAAVTKDISADGLLSVMPVTSLAETGVLSQAFGEMVARLTQLLETIRTQNDQLALLNVTLEERVERRTTQLGAQNLTLTEEIATRSA